MLIWTSTSAEFIAKTVNQRRLQCCLQIAEVGSGCSIPGSYINLSKGGRFRTHPKYETTKHCWVRPAVRIREADEMNYFFAGKSAGRTEPAAAEGARSTEITSVLGPNTTIAGQIVSGGTLHVYGRLEGDIYGEKVELRSGAL